MRRVWSAAAIVGSLAIAALGLPGAASAKPPAGTQKAKKFSGTPTVGALLQRDEQDALLHRERRREPAGQRVDHGRALCRRQREGMVVRARLAPWSLPVRAVAGDRRLPRPTVEGEQNPRRDYAFLTVAPKRIGGRQTEIQTVTGANGLSTGPSRGETVTVPAYPHGAANDPITCTAKVYFDGVFPAFNCNPYVDGTSGSPWLATTPNGIKIVGLIAGLHQGGCTPTPPTARRWAAMPVPSSGARSRAAGPISRRSRQ